jgi:hypothetical protein
MHWAIDGDQFLITDVADMFHSLLILEMCKLGQAQGDVAHQMLFKMIEKEIQEKMMITFLMHLFAFAANGSFSLTTWCFCEVFGSSLLFHFSSRVYVSRLLH